MNTLYTKGKFIQHYQLVKKGMVVNLRTTTSKLNRKCQTHKYFIGNPLVITYGNLLWCFLWLESLFFLHTPNNFLTLIVWCETSIVICLHQYVSLNQTLLCSQLVMTMLKNRKRNTYKLFVFHYNKIDL